MTKDWAYLQEYTDNRGKRRLYFRRGAVRVPLPGPKGSPAFCEAYAAALAGEGKKRPRELASAPAGSISALLNDYYRSVDFRRLRRSTQKTYRSVLEPFRLAHGDKRVSTLPSKWVSQELGKLAGNPAAHNRFLRYLQMLMGFAVREGWRPDDPTARFHRMKTGEGHKPWTEELIGRYEQRWEIGTKQRLALDLLLYSGQRRSDVVTMSKSAVSENAIRVIQQKTGAALWIPLHPKLQESIARTKRSGMYFLETKWEKPYTADGFGNWFRRQCVEAKIPEGYSAHGLRKAAGRRLAEAGCTEEEIKAVLGHQSGEVAKYTKSADQRRLAQEAMEKIG